MSVKSSTTRGKVFQVQSRSCIGEFFVWPSSESKSATLRVRFFAAADAIRTAIIRVFGWSCFADIVDVLLRLLTALM